MDGQKTKSAESGGPVNPAKAAFQEYKRRMGAFPQGNWGNPGNPGQYPGPQAMSPYGPGMPPWPNFPPPGAMPPPTSAPPYPPGTASAGGERSLFASLGTMMRLGIEVMNAALAGGLQLLEGFSGPGGHYPEAPESFSGHPGCGCESSYTCGGGHPCHCGSPHCNPSVHNCP